MVRFFEPTVPPSPPDDLGLPESLFMITDTVLIFDHRTRRLRVVANAPDRTMTRRRLPARRGDRLRKIIAATGQALTRTPRPMLADHTARRRCRRRRATRRARNT